MYFITQQPLSLCCWLILTAATSCDRGASKAPPPTTSSVDALGGLVVGAVGVVAGATGGTVAGAAADVL